MTFRNKRERWDYTHLCTFQVIASTKQTSHVHTETAEPFLLWKGIRRVSSHNARGYRHESIEELSCRSRTVS